MVSAMERAEVRFWSRVEATGFCWNWTGKLSKKGYGVFSMENRTSGVHRIAYELLVGAIPDGLVIDHLCRNRACVNPDHLEPVTVRENNRRGAWARLRSGLCPRGHKMAVDDVGRVRCLKCATADSEPKDSTREASNQRSLEWYYEHQADEKARMAQWRLDNRDKIREQQREYRMKNRERVNAQRRAKRLLAPVVVRD